MRKAILDRYAKTEQGDYVIDITTSQVSDLYNDFDRQSPFIKKELDQDMVEYLSESVQELGNVPFVIGFHFAEEPDTDTRQRVRTSLANYYLYLKNTELTELARTMRTSLIYLLIGVALLFVTVWVNQSVSAQSSVLSKVFAEGLTVAAWVSLWEALASFLVNWFPYSRQIRLYQRIADAPVRFSRIARVAD